MGYNDGDNHAEDNALFEIPMNMEGKRSLIMVNVRLTKTGKIGMARPCPACMKQLKKNKIRKVIYSTNAGTFEEIYL